MKIGFTGTQKGMTDKQKASLVAIVYNNLKVLGNPELEFHHGDCIGANEAAALLMVPIIEQLGGSLVTHPPTDDKKRAYVANKCRSVINTIYPPKEYLARNEMIVYLTDFLIACPAQPTEVLRSGTWATWRFATKLGKRRVLILPSGTAQSVCPL